MSARRPGIGLKLRWSVQGDVEGLEAVRVGGDVDRGHRGSGEAEPDDQRQPAERGHDEGRVSVDQGQGGEAGAGDRGEGALATTRAPCRVRGLEAPVTSSARRWFRFFGRPGTGSGC